jgi:ribosomal protein L37AE/L43A
MDNSVPEKLRPYIAHGVQLSKITTSNEAVGDCPFCDEDKFSVNTLTGQWRCWRCSAGTKKGGGNVYTFLRMYHELCFEATDVKECMKLANNRLLLDAQSLLEWGIAKSVNTGDWLVPGYNPQGHLTTLYRNMKQNDGSYRLIPTPTLGHHIHGMNLWDADKPIVYVCEGPWDGLALWEVMVNGKNQEGHIVPTASREHSLYAQANVIAVPGADVFFESWAALFKGKIVNLMYDNDHPRKLKNGGTTPGAGWRGMERVCGILSSSRHAPQEINCLTWGPEGFDLKLKSGFDVRDMITKG